MLKRIDGWSIGEKLFSKDFSERMKLFDTLVSNIAYGADVWGWYEEERLDKSKRKYVHI